ncbi:arginine--tRNA ligase [Vallitalea okinawensis]|uniref:arginine--tRNA ligase n=1 Tax=Vallitalea okinawensis TaxID=2078660 RepID=UPI000CFE0D7E|nr:arginine--tRNA ligase [Vallitalea okinawensis]
MKVYNQIAQLINSKVKELPLDDIKEILEVPPNTDMGDFAFPCFRLAKVFRKAPNIIASELAVGLKDEPMLDNVEVVGGYLNLFVDKAYLAKNIFESFCDKDVDYGTSEDSKGKTVVLDYSSPNIAKQFHIGHLRTTVIGNALAKIHTALGYKAVRVNHLGDWGTQFGKLIVAYKKWGSKDDIKSKGIDGLMELYIRFHDEAEKLDALNDEAREWFTKMENGNEEALELWNWFKEISMVDFNRVYDLLGVDFDSFAGESFYNDKMQPVVDELREKGLLEESEGANIVDLSDSDMPPVLITKKDGSSLYATRDLAASIYRKNTYNFDKCLYVTGLEQKLHFAQWFKVIEKMGYDWADQLHHIPYGLVSLKSGKLSTRKGQIILLEELLKEAIQRSEEVINDKNPNLENKEAIAKDIGIGAIIFNDLYNNRIKDVIFSWDKVLNFDGETGPYVQYTHARASSLLRKGEYTELNKNIDVSKLTDEYTINVLKVVEKFPSKVREAADKLEPSIITRYIVDVAQAFNKFYHENPILVDDVELKQARLTIAYIVKNVIKNGLDLLGINAPEKM